MVADGVLIWCDKSGNEFAEERDETKAKKTGKAFLKVTDEHEEINTFGLPSPFDLSGDPSWAPGGELNVKYNLRLDARELPPVPPAVTDSPAEVVINPAASEDPGEDSAPDDISCDIPSPVSEPEQGIEEDAVMPDETAFEETHDSSDDWRMNPEERQRGKALEEKGVVLL